MAQPAGRQPTIWLHGLLIREERPGRGSLGLAGSTSQVSSLPVLGGGGSVALPAVLEPVADLGGGEPRGLRQLALLARVRVGVCSKNGIKIKIFILQVILLTLQVPLPQQAPGPLLEAVCLLLPVPDRAWKRILLAHPVLVHRAERSPAQLLRLLHSHQSGGKEFFIIIYLSLVLV